MTVSMMAYVRVQNENKILKGELSSIKDKHHQEYRKLWNRCTVLEAENQQLLSEVSNGSKEKAITKELRSTAKKTRKRAPRGKSLYRKCARP